MNPKNTFLLVLLAAGLFAFIFFFERHRDLAPPPPARLLPGLDIAAVTGIRVQFRGQDEIRAERTTNGTWQLVTQVKNGTINYPAQPIAVENLLEALHILLPQKHISAEELKGKRNVDADYGFEPPIASIVVMQGNDQRTLKLGNPTAIGDQIYAQVVGTEGVDIVSKDIFQYIPRQAVDWRDTMFLNMPGRGTFDRITITNGSRAFILQSDGTNASWHILPHDRVNLYRLAGLYEQLRTLRVVQFKSDEPKPDELESFGLQPPALELDFDRGTNHLLTLQFGRSPTNEPGLVYARRDDQSTVVLVPADVVKTWPDKTELRDRTLAGIYTWLPDEIAVSGHANFTVRRVTNDAWQVIAPYQFPADTNLMKTFVLNLARLSVVPTNGPIAVKDIVPPSEWANYGLATPVWKYVLRANVTNATGLTNAVMAELDFGAVTNNDTLFARRPEEPSVYAVALTNFQQLPISGIQLHERRIWDFTEDQVGRIIIRQDGVPMELLHRAANDWSIAPGSQGILSNPLEVEVGAQELGALAAEDFVEHGGEKRADYGFTDKSLQISAVVAKAGKAEMRTIEFGGWSPRGLRYGMVELGGEKWIFEFPAIVHDRLMSYFSIRENAPAAAHAPAAKTPAAPPVK